MHDLIIRNSLIIDGTGSPPKEGDIAIDRDRIAAIGKISEKGKQEIDGKGAVATPGFIDVHGHSDYFLFLVPTYASKIQQGITTEIGGNCGYAAAPIWGPAAESRQVEYYERYKLKTDWHHLSEYFSRLQGAGISANYTQLIGHNTLRESISGVTDRPLTANEMLQMSSAIEQGFKEGAIGVSTGLIYPPACY
ncbi:MAG TPA: amidohydrolase family protein, partial [Bdellovibrionota bacterium]|nr:amidohydrolase family protein [Bdellovibrionota bacterium]